MLGWQAQILTLFPAMFPGPLGFSLAGKALDAGIWSLDVFDIRDQATDRHRTVDDTPAGGGPGMVMRADIVDRAIEAAIAARKPAESLEKAWRLVYLSPRGRVWDQALAREFAAAPGVTLICGRFEGIDERLLISRQVEEISIGDYVLSGGDVAAMALVDSVVRLLPGVLGAPETLDEESFTGGLLEYPHYTRPSRWAGMDIPEVLASGHHGAIRAWRKAQSERITQERRPDLWAAYQRKGKTDDKDKV